MISFMADITSASVICRISIISPELTLRYLYMADR